MTQLQKYLSIINQFSDKIQSQINKKYRPFLKALFARNIQQRNKNTMINTQKDKQKQKISLGQQMIAFKLGIESKSTKCIELSLNYLNKLFDLGYVDLTAPNYCLNFMILQANIQRKKIDKIQQEIRNQIIRWVSPLAHFKNNQINVLLVKIYRHLIGQNILNALLELVEIYPNQHTYSLLHSYFNYRYYLFQQVYLYKEQEIKQFKYIATNQKLSGQVNNAMNRQEQFQNLVERYVNQIVVKVLGQGGKYGYCVACDQPAEYFCKITKASLCGIECKKAHLQIAQKQYKNYYQSVFLYNSINQSIKTLANYLSQKQSPIIFSIMASLFQKPYLFQLVKNDYKLEMRSFLPSVLYRAYQSKNQQMIQTLYFMIASLAKWWPTQSLVQIQFFIKQHILRILTDKKPNFRLLILVFKCIDKIFENGRSVVQLYTNLDCQINQINAIGNILFQLSKIAQDKFVNTSTYTKQQKITIKNSCMTLFITFSRALNDFRRNYPNIVKVKQLDNQKIRKSNLQKFIQKFNQHWSQGLKCLFNLNLVGLDSNHQIVNIIMSLAGLNKKMIDLMLFDQICEQYLQIFMARLGEEDQYLLLKLLSFYKFIPMTQNNSIGVLKFVQKFTPQFKIPDLLNVVKKITSIFIKAQGLEDFKNKIKEYVPSDADFRYLYLRMLSARKNETIGKKKRIYTLCLSQSYIQPLSSQISLLQIPLSYMLQISYDPDRILVLIRQLTPICIHSNWISLLVKHSGIDTTSQHLLTPYNIKIIKGTLDIIIMQADQIMDWLTILTFICNIYYLLTLSHPHSKKYLTQNKTILLQQLNPLTVQSSLSSASIKCTKNFIRFIHGILIIAKQYLLIDQIMLLQKYFHILDANAQKYINNFTHIFEEFQKFVEKLPVKTSTQTYIYITDMLKQLLLKLIKSTDLSDYITVKHLHIFKLILQKNKNNTQIGDFVMNALSTIVVHNYNIKPRAWLQIIKIVDQQVITYPYQAGVIIRKILNQRMKSIQDQSQIILRICFKLIKIEEHKNSVQAIHDIKIILDLQKQMIENEIRQIGEQQEQQELQHYNKQMDNFKQLLLLSIDQLIKYVGQSFSQAVAQTLFLLFSFKKTTQNLILTQPQLNTLITKIFKKLQQLQQSNLQTSQRIINQTLFWSVKNKYKGIIKNLQDIIVDKYTGLSVTALKCIKIYIQMVNLRDEKQWEDVEEVLLNIILHTQVQRYFRIRGQRQDQQKQNNMGNIIQLLLQNKLYNISKQTQTNINNTVQIDIEKFIHQCRIQMMSVQLLPNHHKCLSILQKVYKNKVLFNDNILIRLTIMNKGLGRQFPPDLLTLQQTISNRIMAIHIWQNNPKQILQFCYQILDKYISSTYNIEILQQYQVEIGSQCNNQNMQLYKIYVDYWRKRMIPLNKLISYIMPKLTKYCENKQDRKKLLNYFITIIPIMENKDTVLKLIAELTDKNLL